MGTDVISSSMARILNVVRIAEELIPSQVFGKASEFLQPAIKAEGSFVSAVGMMGSVVSICLGVGFLAISLATFGAMTFSRSPFHVSLACMFEAARMVAH